MANEIITPHFNILYVEGNTDGTIGGSYYSLYYLIKALDRKKYIPHVVFYGTNELVTDFQKLCEKIILLPLPRTIDFVKQVKQSIYKTILLTLLIHLIKLVQKFVNGLVLPTTATFKYYVLLKKNKIDLVHLNNAIWVNHEWMLAAKLAGIKCISHQRGIEDSQIPRSTFYFVKHLDAVISVSNAVKKSMEDKGLNCNNNIVIYNALNAEDFIPVKTKKEFLQQYNYTDEIPVIGIVGNIRQWKGQEIVLKALHLVRKKFPNILCLIIGKASTDPTDKVYSHTLDQYIKSHNLKDNVLFTGYIKDMADCINALDILVHASIEPEPFGRVFLEAMAIGKPVIGTNIGGVPEIISDGITGILVPPNDPEAIAKAITKYLLDNNFSQSVCNNARENFDKNFTARIMASRTAQLYDSILGQKNT